MINGITSINLTKLDVLDDFKRIKMATHYDLDEKKIDYFPSGSDELFGAAAGYDGIDGWNTNISEMKEFTELPENCKSYIEKLEKNINLKIEFIGNGPGRDDMIYNFR